MQFLKENGTRSISKAQAKVLGQLFNVSPSLFIYSQELEFVDYLFREGSQSKGFLRCQAGILVLMASR
jgi:hypothetical protein